ncbi:hypothetical protein BLNAU_20947 [Blattamonas nauphoetae]|uniref:Uncharacterized protein n=1 Tax=Blattamonas nauphoetae TaxID=2049346 RepID=A0ABQ9WXA7_9EUKA|nr:hypothetical protein BLNAU_20947 [Blattamonas nauphoetae]
MSSPHVACSMDCSAFLNWDEEEPESDEEKAVVFRSLVATLKLQPALDEFLETKAVKLLDPVNLIDEESADSFLNSLASNSDDSSTDFVQSIGVLLSSTSQVITAITMMMIRNLISNCSTKLHLSLIKSDLIPQLINTLNVLSLSFAEAVDIHINVMNLIIHSVWFLTPGGLTYLEIVDENEQQAVHETILTQVLVPSEQYIWHLCVNRYSIVGEEQSKEFMLLLAWLIRICPYYQPTRDFVLHMPVIPTIPSCLTYFEYDDPIYSFLFHMNKAQL